jgi:hypothetical protein
MFCAHKTTKSLGVTVEGMACFVYEAEGRKLKRKPSNKLLVPTVRVITLIKKFAESIHVFAILLPKSALCIFLYRLLIPK